MTEFLYFNIVLQGSSKAVQRAKFLVTQALNTPSTIGQTTPTISTATTSNAMSSSDRTETSSSPAPVRGNYAAIPSSSSEWPTIEQANNMAVQAPPTKILAPNKTEKPSEELKSSPELSDGSQEVFEDNAAMTGKVEDAIVNSSEPAKCFATSSPATSDATQTSSSAWKPYIQSPQSMGACTSAMTTSVSSSVTVISSQNAENRLTSARHDGGATAQYKPFRLQENPGPQVQSQSRNNRVGDSRGLAHTTSQENWDSKVQYRAAPLARAFLTHP